VSFRTKIKIPSLKISPRPRISRKYIPLNGISSFKL
jgi:hypothetical protein